MKRIPRIASIMQITSKKQITDEESINIGIKKLERIYLKHTKDKKIKDQELLDIISNGNLAYELIRPQNFYFKWYIKMISKNIV